MEQQLSEPLKAILLKVAMELKKFRWVPDTQSNEIDVFQGHLSMSKEYPWQGDTEVPDVDVTITVDMHFAQNEQNGVYFLVYHSDYSAFVQDVGGNDKSEDSDIDVPFTERDVNNIPKFIEAAKKINDQTTHAAEEFAYEHSQASSQAHHDYTTGGGWKADQDLNR
jgi:hypothetical protein